MSITKYESIVSNIRTLNMKDIEGRMKMGNLVAAAVNLDVDIRTLATDTGITSHILGTYMATAAYWGDVRVSGASWSQYRSAAKLASVHPKTKVRERIVKKGWDELRVLIAELEPVESEQNYLPTLATAKWELKQTAKVLDRCVQEQVVLTAKERSEFRKQINHILDVATKLGITTSELVSAAA